MIFDNKTVLITGATRGIGKAIALDFAKNGAFVVLNYKENKNAAIEAYEEIKVFTDKILLYQADIQSYSEVFKMVQYILSKLNKIDFLINNAGISNDKLFLNSSAKDWEDLINTNLFGAMNCCHCVLKAMIKNGGGKIVNLSSLSEIDGRIGQSIYAASKSALTTFSKVLSKEVGRWNINVNVIIPGLTESEMTKKVIQENHDNEIKKISLGRIGKPHDISKVVLFLCSTNADYITGSVIKVDGGSAL